MIAEFQRSRLPKEFKHRAINRLKNIVLIGDLLDTYLISIGEQALPELSSFLMLAARVVDTLPGVALKSLKRRLSSSNESLRLKGVRQIKPLLVAPTRQKTKRSKEERKSLIVDLATQLKGMQERTLISEAVFVKVRNKTKKKNFYDFYRKILTEEQFAHLITDQK